MTSGDPFDLQRFVDAQAQIFPLRSARSRTVESAVTGCGSFSRNCAGSAAHRQRNSMESPPLPRRAPISPIRCSRPPPPMRRGGAQTQRAPVDRDFRLARRSQVPLVDDLIRPRRRPRRAFVPGGDRSPVRRQAGCGDRGNAGRSEVAPPHESGIVAVPSSGRVSRVRLVREGPAMSRPLVAYALAALMASPAFAASPPAVEAEHGMVVAQKRARPQSAPTSCAAAATRSTPRWRSATQRRSPIRAAAILAAAASWSPISPNPGATSSSTSARPRRRRRRGRCISTPPASRSRARASTAGAPSRRRDRARPRRSAEEFGALDRATVMAPAIALARDGFALDRDDADIFAAFAGAEGRPRSGEDFPAPDGSSLQAGDRLVQSDLAATLQRSPIRAPGLLRGPIAERIDAAMRANGGVLTVADLAPTGSARTLRSPATIAAIASSRPPPSSGGATCARFSTSSKATISRRSFHSAASVHLMVEAMRHAFLDRNTLLGDPAFVDNPLGRLLSKAYAARIRAAIPPDKSTPSSELRRASRRTRRARRRITRSSTATETRSPSPTRSTALAPA